MTMDTDGGNLWRVPLVSGDSAGMDYGDQGNLIVSENSTTYLVDVGKTVQKLTKPQSVAQTEAGPCKFYQHNNRLAWAVCLPKQSVKTEGLLQASKPFLVGGCINLTSTRSAQEVGDQAPTSAAGVGMWCVTALRARASCTCGTWRPTQPSLWAPCLKPTGPPLRPAELGCMPTSPLTVSAHFLAAAQLPLCALHSVAR